MSFALHAKPAPLAPPPRLLGRHRDVSFHEERFSWLRYEAEHLFEQHYREASADLSEPLAVNWAAYAKLEEAGAEACVVARREGYPVGYAVYLIVPHLHYATQVADADVFFLDPRWRSGWLGVRLLREAEKLLRERGVNEVLNRVKLHVQPGRGGRDLGPLFKFLGYRQVETQWRKRIS